MATSSRQATIFGAQDWQQVYKTFSEADFTSYDYESLRKSFVDYIQQYYPESYNDYIESSEFIALLDVIAFMGQALAFRNDLNARENFIDTAERRDSVVKLANLVGYNVKRNIAGQGYIKVSSISTTESIYDINGLNLSNLVILWNDPANAYWQEQFNAIVNAALIPAQRIGRPGNSATILGVKTDEYTIQQPSGTLPVVPFSSVIDGTSMNFELVSTSTKGTGYVYELPPNTTGNFNMLYRNDGLGYGSANTGFFFYFKQGTLSAYDFTLTQKIPNYVQNIDIQGINNTDTWLYELTADATLGQLWNITNNVYAQASLDTTGSQRKVYSVQSRFNDQVGYVFGDGIVSAVPIGNFRAYVRAGNALQYVIDPEEMQGISVVMNYISRTGKTESLTFTLDLQQPSTTAQLRESLGNIKERAPLQFYSQNRMVNGEDYTTFPYSLYNSIIKSKALNRTSIGLSRNIDLLDPTLKYSSTNSFATDGGIWQDTTNKFSIETFVNTAAATAYLTGDLKNILSEVSTYQYYQNQSGTRNNNGYENRYNCAYNNFPSADTRVYYKQLTANTNATTGYFYILDAQNVEIPINIGVSGGSAGLGNTRLIYTGSLLKILPPTGYYFDANNRLTLVQSTTTKPYVWVQVTSVVGDGSNSGRGALANNTGPVTINNFIPSGCHIAQTAGIIPPFSNSLSQTNVNIALRDYSLSYNFTLSFDSSLSVLADRWKVTQYTGNNPQPTNWFVNFQSQGNGRYLITWRSLKYYWGSVDQLRFLFDVNALVFDPKSGRVARDTITVLPSNTLPTPPNSANTPLAAPVVLNIVNQVIESDGYPDDYAVEVSGTDVDSDGIVDDPDFFNYLTGIDNNNPAYVFFITGNDESGLSRTTLIDSRLVNTLYPNKTAIEPNKLEYPIGQVFYTTAEGKFYMSVLTDPILYTVTLVDVSNNYVRGYGRQGLSFQYQHLSPNTTRVDPGTTNIIDLYVVTQAYYTAYINWLQDTTNTVPKPSKPTINELEASYGAGINSYKMISDTAILNSVTFKPLFGAKAEPALQGTIKVIKQSQTTASDSEIRTATVDAMNTYFSIDNWNFGDTFYFSELSAYLHQELGDFISSAVVVSNDPLQPFGDLWEIRSAPYEIFVNGALPTDIQVIAALTPEALQSNR